MSCVASAYKYRWEEILSLEIAGLSVILTENFSVCGRIETAGGDLNNFFVIKIIQSSCLAQSLLLITEFREKIIVFFI